MKPFLIKHLVIPAIASVLAISSGCGGEDVLDESFNIVNNTGYELQLNYQINASELDASDAANYTEAGEFVADIAMSERILPGHTITFYTITMQQHATWHATGPAEPSEMFESITVEAIEDDQVISHALMPTFEYCQEDFFATEAQEDKISQSNYEYTATINNSDLMFHTEN